jgi:hypothetical protein
MLRALVSELIENAHAAQKILITSSTNMEMSTETWKQVRGELAQIMSVDLYENINTLYLTVPLIKRYPGEVLGIGNKQAEVILQFLTRTRAALAGVVGLPGGSHLKAAADMAFHNLQEVGKMLFAESKKAKPSGTSTDKTTETAP